VLFKVITYSLRIFIISFFGKLTFSFILNVDQICTFIVLIIFSQIKKKKSGIHVFLLKEKLMWKSLYVHRVCMARFWLVGGLQGWLL